MLNELKSKLLQKQYTADIKKGLNQEQVEINRAQYGENKLREAEEKSFFDYLKTSLKDITILILLVAVGISFYLAYSTGSTYIEPLVILAIVILNIVLSIRQSYQADKSMSELDQFSTPTAKVIRENAYQNIPSEDLVVGDILVIETGDRVSADAILVDASNIQMEESILTGESVPAQKDSQYEPKDKDTLSDRKDKVFSGTLVTNGSGLAVVSEVGMDTEMGKISDMLATNEVPQAPLEKRMQQLGRNLGFLAIGLLLSLF